MFDIGWTEILILATVSLFVIGPKEIPKFLSLIGKIIGKIRGISRDLRDSVDDAIKNSELEDIKKEISSIDPGLSNNLHEVLTTSNYDNKTEENKAEKIDKIDNKEDGSIKDDKSTSSKKTPAGFKHIQKKNRDEVSS